MSAKKHRNGAPRPRAKKEIPVIRILNPFNPHEQERTTLTWRAKKTLADYFPVGEVADMAVSVSGRVVLREHFAVTYLDKTDNVVLCPVPRGGGGGKQILSIVAMIALAVAAPMAVAAMGFTAGTFAAGVATAGIMMAGSMLVNAVFAPPKPSTNSDATSSSYGVDGAKNTSLEDIPVPVNYGTYRTGGNIIGLYTTNDADDNQTLYMLISAGEGPISSITDIEINDTPLSDFTNATGQPSTDVITTVEVQTRLGNPNQDIIPWFNETTRAVNKSQKLVTDWYNTSTSAPVDKLRLDFAAPSGLFSIDTKSGSTNSHSVTVEAQYRKLGSSDAWQTMPLEADIAAWNTATYTPSTKQWRGPLGNAIGDTATLAYLNASGATARDSQGNLTGQYPTYAGSLTISSNKRTTVRRSYTTSQLPNGNYEIRVRRTTAHSTDANVIDEVYLADVNEVTLDQLTYPNTALLALKIKLGDLISSIPTVTFVNGGKIINVNDSGAWTQAASNNPAWVVWDILTNARYGGGMPYARLDLVAFQGLANYCTAQGLTWSGPFDTESNVWDATQLVLRVGHSQLVPSGTRYTVVTDKPSTPVMMFSVANMIQGTYKETWLNTADRANEIDVTYFDKTNKYKQRTIKVYDPIALQSKAPQRNSAITLFGVDNYAVAYREAQFQLNMNRYVLKTVEFGAPLEAIACRIGDLVYIQTDLTDWAQAGRFNAGSTTSVLQLDRPVTMSSAKSYNLLMLRDAVQRASGTITNIIGNSVYLSNDPSSLTIKRVQAGGKDVGIDGVFGGGIIVQDATGLAVGQPYTLWDTDVIEEYPVVANTGTFTAVTLQAPCSAAPEQFRDWMFGEATKVKKIFRIKAISGSAEYRRDITAIEYRTEVYDYTRFSDNLAVAAGNIDSNAISPALGLNITEETYIVNSQIESNVVIGWAASAVGLYGGASVYVQKNDGPMTLAFDAKNRTSASLPAARGDVFNVRVVAYDIYGNTSSYDQAPTATYTVVGEITNIIVASPTGAGFVWSGRDCKISWRYNSMTHSYEFGSEPTGADAGSLDPHFKDYEIRVYNADGVTLRRTEHTTDNSYVYIFDKNFSDGLSRQLTFELRQRDIFNNLSSPIIIDAYNPPPTITSTTVVPSFETAVVNYTHSDDPDFAGVQIWASQNTFDLDDLTSGAASACLVYDGPNTSATLARLMFAATYYFRMAAYDAFGKIDLQPTPKQSFVTTNLNVEAIADGMLAGSKLLPVLQSRINQIDAPDIGLLSQVASLGQKVVSLQSQVSGIGDTSGVLAQAESYVQGYAYSKADTDSAIAATSNTITSGYKTYADQAAANAGGTALTNAQGYVQTYAYTKSATDGAISALGSQLRSEFSSSAGVTAAYVQNYTYAKADSDSAMTSQFNSLTSNYKSADTAAIGSAVSQAQSYVQSYSYSKADANTAIANSTSQVSARLNNINGSGVTVEQQMSAQANSISGLSGQYTVKVDANGFVAGFGLAVTSINGTPTSQFAIRADSFAVVTSADTVAPFVVGSVNGQTRTVIQSALIGDASINNAMIGDAQVNTLKIAGQSVTVPSFAMTTGGTTFPAASGAVVQTLSVNSSGAPIFVSFGAQVGPPSYTIYSADGGYETGVASTWGYQLWRDGNVIFSATGASEGGTISFSMQDTPGAGAHTYQLYVYSSSQNYNHSYNGAVANRSITTIETKR